MKKKLIGFSFLGVLLVLIGCSTTKSVYVKQGYESQPKMVKRIKIIVESSQEDPQLSNLVAHLATDIIKLKRNYLIYGFRISKESCFKNCDNLDGVVLFKVGKVKNDKVKAELEIKAELYDCYTKNLVWQAIGWDRRESADEDLANLTSVYHERFPEAARIFAAPAFVIIQDLIKTMPNPSLNDQEILKKIELEGR